jgi:hypothetical protein
VVRAQLQGVVEGDGGAGLIAGVLQDDAQVVLEVSILGLQFDSGLEGAFGLGMKALLAIGDSQQGLGIRILIVRHYGARQEVDGFIEVLIAEGRHALIAKGRGR